MNQRAVQFIRNYMGSYPTMFVVAVLYVVFVILNVTLVAYEILKLNRSHADMHITYCDGLPELMFAVELLLVFGVQFVLFLVAAAIGRFIDDRRLKQDSDHVKLSVKTKLYTISIVSIFLLLPAWGIYGSNYWHWSLFHDVAFQITASPKEKLDRDFVWNVLNRGYDKAKIKAYLDRGADINLWGCHGTPLILATKAEDEEFVNELLSRGANVNATAGERRTALAYALEGNTSLKKYSAARRRIAVVLLARGTGPQVNEYGNPLNTAVQHFRDKELVEKLLTAESQLDPHVKELFLSTALMRAAYVGNDMAVLTLLDHGANVNYRDTSDWNTPLTKAIRWNHVETVRLLILHGANVACQKGPTPLKIANTEIYNPRTKSEIIRLLQEAGARD